MSTTSKKGFFSFIIRLMNALKGSLSCALAPLQRMKNELECCGFFIYFIICFFRFESIVLKLFETGKLLGELRALAQLVDF